MIKRCIMIFPDFNNGQVIDDVRRKYDPLVEHVQPHITLVFPFESDIEKSVLEEYISKTVEDIKPFNLVLSGIAPSNSTGNYLFLNIKEGKDEIMEIHNRLYRGILKSFYPQWLKDIEFLPHMTVGNLNDPSAFERAVEETKNIDEVFETIVREISVEIIDENEDSIIEIIVPL